MGRLDGRSVRWVLPLTNGTLPPNVSEAEVVQETDEELVWGGGLLPHHGHFMLESVGRLWPLIAGGAMEGRRVVFGGKAQAALTRASTDWLEAFGANQITLPREGLMRFTALAVPELAWLLRSWCCPEIRDIHLQARRGLQVPPVRLPRDVVWLSRSKLDTGRTLFDEWLLEWLLEDHVTTIHPELLPLVEQVGILKASRAIVGISGSAFHNLLLAERIPPCLYLCDDLPKPGYIAQQELLGHQATFAMQCVRIVRTPHRNVYGLRFPHAHRLDIPAVLRALSASVLPELLGEPRLAAFADPASR